MHTSSLLCVVASAICCAGCGEATLGMASKSPQSGAPPHGVLQTIRLNGGFVLANRVKLLELMFLNWELPQKSCKSRRRATACSLQ